MTNIGRLTIANVPILTICNAQNKEIVRIESDGAVIWPNGVDIESAAVIFGNSLKLGVEYAAGITDSVRSDIKRNIYNEIIEECKSKGFLTVDDLTYLQEATKIVDNLRGSKD